MIVSLWSGPRNCSTALMYSVAQRPDFRVLDEPLFAHFLQHTGVDRPSREEVLATMPTERPDILPAFRTDEGHLFLKHMANHLEGWPHDDFAAHRHVILTRHPRRVLKSYRAHIEQPTALDLCYHHQHAWLKHCQEAGWPVAVLDSDRLVANPEKSLTELMQWLGLKFDPGMLSWAQGPRAEDGVWAKYWYHRVHASTGWNSGAAVDRTLPELEPQFNALIQELEPLYVTLSEQAIN